MLEVLGACSNCGMSIPLGPHHQNIPDDIILWHDARSAYPGETMQAAHRAAAQYWRIPPDIIFVILPDRGKFLWSLFLHGCRFDSWSHDWMHLLRLKRVAAFQRLYISFGIVRTAIKGLRGCGIGLEF